MPELRRNCQPRIWKKSGKFEDFDQTQAVERLYERMMQLHYDNITTLLKTLFNLNSENSQCLICNVCNVSTARLKSFSLRRIAPTWLTNKQQHKFRWWKSVYLFFSVFPGCFIHFTFRGLGPVFKARVNFSRFRDRNYSIQTLCRVAAFQILLPSTKVPSIQHAAI